MSETGASVSLRSANADVWDAMQAHRFVADIEADRLPHEALCRYFVFEHDFVATALVIFGHALIKAPGLAQKRRLVAMLHALSEAQLAWFARCFAALGIDEPNATAPAPAPVQAFGRGMLEVAERGSYADILAVMLAAEWMYATWCGRAARRPARNATLAEWVRLHAEPPFLDGVAWLRGEIDREGAALDAAGRQRLCALFRHALQLEIGFHDAAYDESWTWTAEETTR